MATLKSSITLNLNLIDENYNLRSKYFDQLLTPSIMLCLGKALFIPRLLIVWWSDSSSLPLEPQEMFVDSHYSSHPLQYCLPTRSDLSKDIIKPSTDDSWRLLSLP